MYHDFFSENGIPQGIATSLATLLFLVSISPLFSGGRVFGVDFPNLTKLGKTLATLVGCCGLLLMIIGFQPMWVNKEVARDQLPYCYIETTKADASGNFEVRWFTDAEGEVWSRLEQNGYLVDDDPTGAVTTNIKRLVEPSVYVLIAGNRFGTCSRTITLQPAHNAVEDRPGCSLTVSNAKASAGDIFTVEWVVSGPSGTMAYINGSRVELTGQKSFTFDAENYSRFRLVANFDGYTCEDNARIISE